METNSRWDDGPDQRRERGERRVRREREDASERGEGASPEERLGQRPDVLPQLSRAVIGCAMRVHAALGPGLLESAYEACLCRELALASLRFRRQVPLRIEYSGITLHCAYRMDLIVENRLVVELKCVEQIQPIHRAQLLTYLRLSGTPLGLIVNFNVTRLCDGVRRVVNSAGAGPGRPNRT